MRKLSRVSSLVALASAVSSLALAQGAPAPSGGPVVTSTFAPELPRGMTRVRGTVRPFLSLLGKGGGAIVDLSIDHYFARLPLRLSLELSPLALAVEGDGTGAIGHARVGAAYATDYVEIGGSVGSRIQNYGGAGISLAGFLRLGALDGLNLTATYGYLAKRNRYTGVPGLAMSNITGAINVPLSQRFSLFAEGGMSVDMWMYTSLGLRHRMTGDGRAGTWFISGAFGLGWVVDRPECAYPDTGWCKNSAWAMGPTLSLGLERRF
jgi:hypothetical protein